MDQRNPAHWYIIFTFQKITYIVDVYRGTRQALHSFVDFALYVAFFPQLIAGPIVRFHEISEQLKRRIENFDKFYQGSLRFCFGLVKKVVFANSCAEIADAVFALDMSLLDTKVAWLGLLAYTLQIYLDFSAYSDMAIGLGEMFGFKLPENFNRPYSAVSITDFWRRWHITLSNFFRDYLYIPLGGNRSHSERVYYNLIIVFLLCGFWHGANWTFLLWGMYHGSLLIIERLSKIRNIGEGTYRVPRRLITFILVMIGWVFFRATHFWQAVHFLKKMFSPVNLPMPFELMYATNTRNLTFLILAALVVLLPREFSGSRFLLRQNAYISRPAMLVLLVIFVFYSIVSLAAGSYNPFIYFQF